MNWPHWWKDDEALIDIFGKFKNYLTGRIIKSKTLAHFKYGCIKSAQACIRAMDGQVFRDPLTRDVKRLTVRMMVLNDHQQRMEEHKFNERQTTITELTDVRGTHDLFISNLPDWSTNDMLRKLFHEFGHIVFVKKAINSDNGKPKGYARLKYSTLQSAQLAIEGMDGQKIEDPIRKGEGGGRLSKQPLKVRMAEYDRVKHVPNPNKVTKKERNALKLEKREKPLLLSTKAQRRILEEKRIEEKKEKKAIEKERISKLQKEKMERKARNKVTVGLQKAEKIAKILKRDPRK
jgi:RNA recognition motif-containing protein